jgi:integrase
VKLKKRQIKKFVKTNNDPTFLPMNKKQNTYHFIQNLPSEELLGQTIPAILVDEPDNPLLLEAWYHLTCREHASMSPSWRQKATWTIGRLYDWHRATQHATPNKMIDTFIVALEFGTIDQNGNDQTGLFWDPSTPQTLYNAKLHLKTFLAKLGDYIEDNSLSQTRFANIISFKNSSHSLLSHLSKPIHRTAKSKQQPQVRPAKSFPKEYLPALVWEGCKRNRPQKEYQDKDGNDTLASLYNLPLMMAIILMTGGGIRYSEIFHIFTADVFKDTVKLVHPSHGVMEKRGNKIINRETFLRETYNTKPRHLVSGQQHSGWKHLLIEDQSTQSSTIYFLPGWQDLFFKVYQAYKEQIMPHTSTHPYLFISIDTKNFGNPWTIPSFRKSFIRALNRIGLDQDATKGLNPHGLRHLYGQTLVNMDVSPLIIQTCMHHMSLDSQLAYTRPTSLKINQSMKDAAMAIKNGDAPKTSLKNILNYSYKSDPAGLFSSMGLGIGNDKL